MKAKLHAWALLIALLANSTTNASSQQNSSFVDEIKLSSRQAIVIEAARNEFALHARFQLEFYNVFLLQSSGSYTVEFVGADAELPFHGRGSASEHYPTFVVIFDSNDKITKSHFVR